MSRLCLPLMGCPKRPLLMTASACGSQSLGEEKHIYDKTCIAASPLAQEMRPVCAQYARQFFEQICVSHHLPRPTRRAHRHGQVKKGWISKTQKSFPTFCLALSPSGRDEMLGNKVLCNLMCVFDGSSRRIAAIAKGWWLCTVLGADTNWLRFLAGLTCTSSGHTCRSLGAYDFIQGAAWNSCGPRHL